MKGFVAPVAVALLALSSSCTHLGPLSPAQPTAYHTVYKLTSCGTQVTRDEISAALSRLGYLKGSYAVAAEGREQPPYDVFRSPASLEPGSSAPKPAEPAKPSDSDRDLAVAVCPGASEHYILVQQPENCGPDSNDIKCARRTDGEVSRFAQEWGCEVSQRSARSIRWQEEDESTWTRDTCQFVITHLPL